MIESEDANDQTKADEKHRLETKKLELEIAELEWNRKRKVSPLILQLLLPLLLAAATLLTYFMSNSNGAAINYNQALIKTIALDSEQIKLHAQIIGFENEKSTIANEVDSLNGLALTLKDKLGFALIARNLQLLKRDPGPEYFSFKELSDVIRNDTLHKRQVIDSLQSNFAVDSLADISYFLLYESTHESRYFKMLLSKTPYNLTRVRWEHSLSFEYYQLLVCPLWTNNDRLQISETLLANFDKAKSPYVKAQILNIIGQYGLDSTFPFSTANYELYLRYLQLNRDIFLSADTLMDKYSLLVNIEIYSPPLFCAVILKGYNDMMAGDSMTAQFTALINLRFGPIQNTRINNARIKFFKLNKFDSIWKFGVYYTDNKKAVDSWLYGNFDKFRKHPEMYANCVRSNSF